MSLKGIVELPEDKQLMDPTNESGIGDVNDENSEEMERKLWQKERMSKEKHTGVTEDDAAFYERHLKMRIEEEKSYRQQRKLNPSNYLNVPPTARHPAHNRAPRRDVKHSCIRYATLLSLIFAILFIQDTISGRPIIKSFRGVLNIKLLLILHTEYSPKMHKELSTKPAVDLKDRESITYRDLKHKYGTFNISEYREKKNQHLVNRVLRLFRQKFNLSSPLAIHPRHHREIAEIIQQQNRKRAFYLDPLISSYSSIGNIDVPWETLQNIATVMMLAFLFYLLIGPTSHVLVRVAQTTRRISQIAIVLAAPSACIRILLYFRITRSVLRHAWRTGNLTEFLYGEDVNRNRLRHRRYQNFLIRPQ